MKAAYFAFYVFNLVFAKLVPEQPCEDGVELVLKTRWKTLDRVLDEFSAKFANCQVHKQRDILDFFIILYADELVTLIMLIKQRRSFVNFN